MIKPAVSVEDPKADPADTHLLVLPNKLGVPSQTGHTPVTMSNSSKRLLFGQKQLVNSRFFFVVLCFVVKGLPSPIWFTVLCANCVIALARSSFRLIQPVQLCRHV